MLEVLDDPCPPEFDDGHRRMVHERAAQRRRKRQLGLVAATVAPLAMLLGGLTLVSADRSTDTPPLSTAAATIATAATLPEPDTTVSATTAAPPPELPPPLVVGGLIVRGAVDDLGEAGFIVDADPSRSFAEMVGVLERIASTGDLPDAVVVNIADNGPIFERDVAALLQGTLRTMSRVVFVTTTVGHEYADANNELIRSLPSQYANVAVLDWDDAVADCPGDCLYPDRVHLRPDGVDWFTRLAAAAIENP